MSASWYAAFVPTIAHEMQHALDAVHLLNALKDKAIWDNAQDGTQRITIVLEGKDAEAVSDRLLRWRPHHSGYEQWRKGAGKATTR